MIDSIKKLFGIGPKKDITEMIRQGAVILDVRTKGEYDGGHIRGSINIPVQNLKSNLSKLGKDKTIITCCVSGIRSASAKSILLSNGFKEVHNGGGWMSLKSKIS